VKIIDFIETAFAICRKNLLEEKEKVVSYCTQRVHKINKNG
jgi:hypothetical protein